MSTFKLTMIVKLISVLIANVSPDIKDKLHKGILDLEVKAKETKNPFDDLLVEALKTILM